MLLLLANFPDDLLNTSNIRRNQNTKNGESHNDNEENEPPNGVHLASVDLVVLPLPEGKQLALGVRNSAVRDGIGRESARSERARHHTPFKTTRCTPHTSQTSSFTCGTHCPQEQAALAPVHSSTC